MAYVNHAGVRTTKTQGLNVPTLDPHGKPLLGPAYEAALSEVRARALRMWNKLDCSKRDRLRVPDDEGPDA